MAAAMCLVIERTISEIGAEALAGRQRDCLVMTAEERRWLRRIVRSAGGREIALAFPTGSVIAPGALLVVEPQWYLEVEAAKEAVLTVSPRDYKTALRIAFEIGNHHFPLALDGSVLLAPDDPAIEQLLTRLGVEWGREHRVFDPIGRRHEH
jgi:urease accessory protein UreE